MKTSIIILILIFSNCLAGPLLQKTNGPVHGLFFTQNKFPGEINPANDVPSTKRAEGCLHYIFFFIMWGDASAGSIALQNKIKRISSIDHSTLSAFGIYGNYCTIVRGE